MASSKPGPRPLSHAQYAALAHLRYELRRLQHLTSAAAGELGLTPRQHEALLSVQGGKGASQAVGELARRLLIKPNSATGLVARLREGGLLEGVDDPEDRRVVRVRLTASGVDLLAGLSREHRSELRRLKPLVANVTVQRR